MSRTQTQSGDVRFEERLAERLRDRLAGEIMVERTQASSRNTMIYRVRSGGTLLVAKAELGTRPTSVQEEYEMLLELQRRLAGSGVRSLVPVAAYPDLGVLVTQEEPGETVRSYIDRALADPDRRPFVEDLMDPCAEALYRFQAAFGIVREGAVERACSYMDFHPGNLLLTAEERRTPVLMDPPPKEPMRPVHFDVGTFCFGIARAGFTPCALVRFPQQWLDRLKADFVAAYFRRLGRPVRAEDLALIKAFERRRAARALLRYAQFFRYRNWLRELARLAWFSPIIGSYLVLHLPRSYRRLARAYPLPVLPAEAGKRS